MVEVHHVVSEAPHINISMPHPAPDYFCKLEFNSMTKLMTPVLARLDLEKHEWHSDDVRHRLRITVLQKIVLAKSATCIVARHAGLHWPFLFSDMTFNVYLRH